MKNKSLKMGTICVQGNFLENTTGTVNYMSSVFCDFPGKRAAAALGCMLNFTAFEIHPLNDSSVARRNTWRNTSDVTCRGLFSDVYLLLH